MRITLIIASFLLMVSCQQDNRALVVGKIQKASKLATTEFTVDKIVYGEQDKKLAWVFKLNQTHFLAYSKANIKAGIDLNQLKPENIKIDGNMIEIELPAVEVINFSYPASSFKMDHEISNTKSFLNEIGINKQEKFFRLAELDIRDNLQYMGIVKTTQENTRKMLTTLMKSLGYEEIYINFENNNLIIDTVNYNPATP